MNTNNKTWVDGLRIFENKQDWIVCDVKINADQMIKWINDNRANVNERGSIPITIAKSEKGFYSMLNTYEIQKSKEVTTAQHSPDREDLPF
tara:strand:- start:587 stop:859 length:273 start_codon:yes stop_codon:yes gene_type:complete